MLSIFLKSILLVTFKIVIAYAPFINLWRSFFALYYAGLYVKCHKQIFALQVRILLFKYSEIVLYKPTRFIF
jgi:hypothetical protein